MHAHSPHPCPRTGKCCGRCKLAMSGNGTAPSVRSPRAGHPHHGHPEAEEFSLLALADNMDAEPEY